METDEEERKALSYSEKKGIKWELSASNFQHHRMDTLVIFGFRPQDRMTRSYVGRVMEAAVNLKVVFMYGRLECGFCHIEPPKPSPSTGWKKSFVENVITKGINSSAIVHFQDESAIGDAYLAKKLSLLISVLSKHEKIA